MRVVDSQHANILGVLLLLFDCEYKINKREKWRFNENWLGFSYIRVKPSKMMRKLPNKYYTDFRLVYLQQVDEKYVRTIHLHSSGGSGSSAAGKNAHRSKTSTNSQSRDRHESSGPSRARSLASQSAAHGEYFAFNFIFI